jgi:hypothetical protein
MSLTLISRLATLTQSWILINYGEYTLYLVKYRIIKLNFIKIDKIYTYLGVRQINSFRMHIYKLHSGGFGSNS